MESLVGKTLGQYQIVQELGRGGMAVVYKAYQPSLTRYVAIKVLPPQLSFDQDFVERFAREARAAAVLHHPNIITIHDVSEQEGIHYFVMEYLAGKTLDAVMAETPMPLPRIVHIISQIADALDHAHAQGLIHRDIKPSNIIVEEARNDHVVLTDFGLVRARQDIKLTKTGTIVGTPEYMSPEQVLGETIDYRTDIYSLGVVLYRMLAGAAPFVRPTPAAVLMAHVSCEPPPVTQVNPQVPKSVEVVVFKAMDKDREKRYQSAGDLARELQVAVVSQATAAKPPHTTPSAAPPANPHISAKPALLDGQRRYFLSPSGPTLIGRQGCAIMLAGPDVALQHARVVPVRNGFTLEALGPVQVNNTPVSTPTLLRPGDTVRIGATNLIFEGPLPPEQAPQPRLGYDELFDKVKNSVVAIRRDQSLGSGFFVHPSGLIVTNRHVVGYERQVAVHLIDGRQSSGRVVRAFPEVDLAFVRVEGLSPLVSPFAPPAMIRVGQAVLVIGHPLGLANTLTRGIISAVDREVMGNVYLQTDAAINPGNSGGPLFNDLGEVIGVATLSIGRAQGLNFAVPAEQVRRRMKQVLAEEARVQQGQGVYCIVCGLYSAGGAYCPGCGVSLTPAGGPVPQPAAPVRCPNCGKALNPGDVFCSGCGTRLQTP